MSSHHSHEEQPTSELPSYLRARHVSNIQDDEDFLMDNLHDLNLDLRHRMRPAVASGDLVEKKPYHGSDVDGESQFGSEPYARPDSRNSTAIDFDDESPYPEVRASISNVDDPNMPYNTFRVWCIGLIFSIVIPGANQLLLFRWPSVYITGIITQLVSFPIGKAMAFTLPTWKFKAFGRTFSLNPGPFSIKEHVCITIMCNLASMGVYATDVIAAQRLYYNSPTPIGYQILLITGVQIVGFAYAGYLRRFVVWPSSMIWPGALVNAALFNTLHQTFSKVDDNRMSRHRYFLYVSVGAFLYYWLPGYLFVALSTFNWVCWIAPENPTVNILFGTQTGLGMSLFTFDWSMISFLGSPLVTPWWAQLNGYVTVVILYWIIVPALYFTNTFFSANLPILSTRSFDNTGVRYNASSIVTNGIFDDAKYQAYSPVFMTASMAIAYARDFALFPAVIVHTLLWFRGDIMKRLRSSIHSERDIHSRLMAVYPEVPTWWYAIFGVIATIFLCVAVEIVPTQLPIWATLFALGLSAIISVPLAMLQAITNQQVSLNVMYELIIGYALPGKPIANTIFKAIAWQSGASAISFSGDLKLGHYMKIPPRMMFTIQIISGTISALVALGMQEWAFRNIEGICEPDQKDNFVCPGTNLFATASLLWGAIGPKRLFEEQYGPLFYFFLAGSLLPIPFYLMARRYPLSLWRYINIPIALSGAQVFPPGNGQNYTTWIIVGFIFNYFIRRYHMQWHLRYNYVTSAALDFGTALSVIVIYFAVYFPKGPNGEGYPLNWWGNSVYANTLDGNAVSLLTLEDGQTFGPTTWS